MPISFQCLQNKNIGEFYNETHKEYNHLLMRCNSNHKNRVDNYNDNSSNFKESGVVMDLISATNNNFPDFRKKTGVDTTKKTLVTLAIFLLSIKQSNSASSNSSTEVSITTFPSSNQTYFDGLGVIDSLYEVTDDYQKKQLYIGSGSDVTLMSGKNKVKKNRMKRIPGGNPGGIKELQELITTHHNELMAMDRARRINFLLAGIAENPGRFGLRIVGALHRPLVEDDLPLDFINIMNDRLARLDMVAVAEPLPGDEDPEPPVEEQQVFGDDAEDDDPL